MTEQNENQLVDMEKELQKYGYSPDALADLSQEEKMELAEALQIDVEASNQGFNFKPIEFKINKDLCKFVGPEGNTYDSLEGALIYKKKERQKWSKDPNENLPLCSSLGCVCGIDRETNEQITCATCPDNKWGTAVDSNGNHTRGKNCGEKRIIFLEVDGYHMPGFIRIPTSSITAYDNYFSTRRSKRILDIQKGIEMTLDPAKSNGFKYAVVNFGLGEDNPPKKILEMNKMKPKIEDFLENRYVVTRDDDEDVIDVTPEEPGSNIQLDDVSADDIA